MVAPRARRGLLAQSGRHGEHPGPNRRRLQSELAGQVQARGLAQRRVLDEREVAGVRLRQVQIESRVWLDGPCNVGLLSLVHGDH